MGKQAQKQDEYQTLDAVVPTKLNKQEQKYVDNFIKFVRKNGLDNSVYSDDQLKELGIRMYTSHFSDKSFDEITGMLKGKEKLRYQLRIGLVLDDLHKQGEEYLEQIKSARANGMGDVRLVKNWDSSDILAIQYALYIKTPGNMTMDGIIGKETTKKLDTYLFKKVVVDRAVYRTVDLGKVDKQYLKDTELKPTKEKNDLMYLPDLDRDITGGSIDFQISSDEKRNIYVAMESYKNGDPTAFQEIVFRYAYSSHGGIAPKHVEEAMLYMLCYGQYTGAFELRKEGTMDAKGKYTPGAVYTIDELAELMKTKEGRKEIIESFQTAENARLYRIMEKNETAEMERMKGILTLLSETWLPEARGSTGANYFGVGKQYIEGPLTDLLREWEDIRNIKDPKKRKEKEDEFVKKNFGYSDSPVSVDGILGPQTILSMLFLTPEKPPVKEKPPEKTPPKETPKTYAANVVYVEKSLVRMADTEESEPIPVGLGFFEKGIAGEVPLEEFIKNKNIPLEAAEITYYGIMVVSDLMPNQDNKYGFFVVNPRKTPNGGLEREQEDGAAYSAYYDPEKKAFYPVDKGGKVIKGSAPILQGVSIVKEEGEYRVRFEGYPWELPTETIKQLFTVRTKMATKNAEDNKTEFVFPNYGAETRTGKPIGFLEVWGSVREKEGSKKSSGAVD